MNTPEAAAAAAQMLGAATGFAGIFFVLIVEKRMRDWERNWECLDRLICKIKGDEQEFTHLAPRGKIERLFSMARNPNDPFSKSDNHEWAKNLTDILNNLSSIRDSVTVFMLIVGIVTAVSIRLMWVSWSQAQGCIGFDRAAPIFCIGLITVFVFWALTRMVDLDGYWVIKTDEWKALRSELKTQWKAEA